MIVTSALVINHTAITLVYGEVRLAQTVGYIAVHSEW